MTHSELKEKALQKKNADYNGFRGGSNLLNLLRHKIILIGQITIY